MTSRPKPRVFMNEGLNLEMIKHESLMKLSSWGWIQFVARSLWIWPRLSDESMRKKGRT